MEEKYPESRTGQKVRDIHYPIHFLGHQVDSSGPRVSLPRACVVSDQRETREPSTQETLYARLRSSQSEWADCGRPSVSSSHLSLSSRGSTLHRILMSEGLHEKLKIEVRPSADDDYTRNLQYTQAFNIRLFPLSTPYCYLMGLPIQMQRFCFISLLARTEASFPNNTDRVKKVGPWVA